MAVYLGRVVDGKVIVEGASLPEGADVEVYVVELARKSRNQPAAVASIVVP